MPVPQDFTSVPVLDYSLIETGLYEIQGVIYLLTGGTSL